MVAFGLMNAVDPALPQVDAEREGGLRLTSLSLQFLRAARAEETRFAGRVLRGGARTTYLMADAIQQAGDRQVAMLQAQCV